mmetsp:Transcript_13518/g.40875  ORF Transcript_13518/g.40875 Transcript_13518/m.40875 type:complete len:360 (-) Transcript_13518:478-1557(-)
MEAAARRQNLAQQLERRLGLRDPVITRHLLQICRDVHEAALCLGRMPDGSTRCVWSEMYSEESQRLYYAERGTPQTSWDPPQHFRFQDWTLDCSTYGIDIATSKAIFEAVHHLQGENRGGAWKRPVALLIKILGNVVDCGNTEAKFRTLQLRNAKFQEGVWEVFAARQVLEAVGFRVEEGAVQLSEDAPLAPLQAALARLRRVADLRGHSGSAEFFPLSACGAGGAIHDAARSPLLGMAGYRHQQRIHHCNACGHGINDGSERLFTGLYTAPRGEFRYQCTTCERPFNLCEGCWDRLSAGELQHGEGHNFQHHHPRTQRHNWQDEDVAGASPWGVRAGAGGSAARALQRMHERHGMTLP